MNMRNQTNARQAGNTLLVRPVGTALVQNFEALDNKCNRFIGRTFNADAGGWMPTGEAERVPDRHEYRQAIKHGDLEPADAETAKKCGMPYFGIDHNIVI